MSSKRNKTIRQTKRLLDKAEHDVVNKVYEELTYNSETNKCHQYVVWYCDTLTVPMLALIIALALPHVSLFLGALFFIVNSVVMAVWLAYRYIIPRVLRKQGKQYLRERFSFPFIVLSALLIIGGLPMLAFTMHAAIYEGWYDDWGSIARWIPSFLMLGILILNYLSVRKMFWGFWQAAR